VIKDIENVENLTMNVVLKDGTKFEGMDMPSRPFDNERFVSFWVGDAVRMYPIANVDYIEFVSNNKASG
jgi:hypothetical protein